MDNNLTFQININGNVFTGVGKLQGDFSELVNVVGRVDSTINTTFDNLKSKIENINLNAVIQQVQHVSRAMSDISKPGIALEQGMADLSSITGTVGDDLVELQKVARKTGAESGLGAEQAAKAFMLLASQIQVDDIGLDGLKKLQENTITLSHAAGMSLDEAANALAGTINQFGLEAGEAARVIDVLAAGSKYGAADINDLAQSFKVVGAQASIAGLSVEDTAGALEVLSKSNLKGAEAGTHLRNIILRLQTTMGVDFSQTSLAEALDALKPKLNDASFMSETFGRSSMAAAQYLVQNAGAVEELTDKVTGTNTAQEQAAIRTGTTQAMMERCRAKVDDLKIGFFELTGSLGGYMTIVGEQAVTVAQLLPLLTLMAKGIRALTDAEKRHALWAGIVKVATVAWTGIQWAFNAALWACPLTWIVMAIVALIAVIVLCATKVEGWGRQWDSITKFMKLTGQLFVETIKHDFNTMVNGIMVGLDYIKLGWYKFKNAVGIGNGDKNREMIAQINSDIEARKQAISDGADKIRNLAEEANNALTWELSWKKKDGEADTGQSLMDSMKPPTAAVSGATTTGTGGNFQFDFDKGGKGGKSGGQSNNGTSGAINLNEIIPDLKGSSAYASIASKLSAVRAASITAASLAMPLAAAATPPPPVPDFANEIRNEYVVNNSQTITNPASTMESDLLAFADSLRPFGEEELEDRRYHPPVIETPEQPEPITLPAVEIIPPPVPEPLTILPPEVFPPETPEPIIVPAIEVVPPAEPEPVRIPLPEMLAPEILEELSLPGVRLLSPEEPAPVSIPGPQTILPEPPAPILLPGLETILPDGPPPVMLAEVRTIPPPVPEPVRIPLPEIVATELPEELVMPGARIIPPEEPAPVSMPGVQTILPEPPAPILLPRVETIPPPVPEPVRLPVTEVVPPEVPGPVTIPGPEVVPPGAPNPIALPMADLLPPAEPEPVTVPPVATLLPPMPEPITLPVVDLGGANDIAANLPSIESLGAEPIPVPEPQPLTASATAWPGRDGVDIRTTEYIPESRDKGVSMNKFCEKVEIHIANADGKGYRQIEKEVTQVLRKVFDDYGA